MDALLALKSNPRVTVRRDGAPDPDGTCVVYWMQHAQRGIDNPALDTAVQAANALGKPAVVFFAPRPFPPVNLRHYAFLAQGIPDIAEALAKRKIGFVLRRFPDHRLLKFCEEVRPALVVGDENPIRQARAWREAVARKLKASPVDRRRRRDCSCKAAAERAVRRLHRPASASGTPEAVSAGVWKSQGSTLLEQATQPESARAGVALAVQKADVSQSTKDAFLNQVITWRELSVNLVHFNPNYDNFECAEAWAHRTLAKHAREARPRSTPRALHRDATGKCRDPRSPVERRAGADGYDRLDAQLRSHVLGKEDSGVDQIAGGGPSNRRSPER
jgi:hypothetical protein